jgi:hypothetical protein
MSFGRTHIQILAVSFTFEQPVQSMTPSSVSCHSPVATGVNEASTVPSRCWIPCPFSWDIAPQSALTPAQPSPTAPAKFLYPDAPGRKQTPFHAHILSVPQRPQPGSSGHTSLCPSVLRTGAEETLAGSQLAAPS